MEGEGVIQEKGLCGESCNFKTYKGMEQESEDRREDIIYLEEYFGNHEGRNCLEEG